LLDYSTHPGAQLAASAGPRSAGCKLADLALFRFLAPEIAGTRGRALQPVRALHVRTPPARTRLMRRCIRVAIPPCSRRLVRSGSTITHGARVRALNRLRRRMDSRAGGRAAPVTRRRRCVLWASRPVRSRAARLAIPAGRGALANGSLRSSIEVPPDSTRSWAVAVNLTSSVRSMLVSDGKHRRRASGRASAGCPTAWCRRPRSGLTRIATPPALLRRIHRHVQLGRSQPRMTGVRLRGMRRSRNAGSWDGRVRPGGWTTLRMHDQMRVDDACRAPSNRSYRGRQD